MQTVKASPLYREGQHFQNVLSMELRKLQQWVRGSFMHDGAPTLHLKKFMDAVVKPSLACSAHDVPAQMQSVVACFTAIVKGGLASQEDLINLRIASSALKGEISSHPLVQGLMLQCRRLVQRQAEGKSMRGRRDGGTTERENALIADAGLTLALHCGNATLAREFGLAGAACKVSLPELQTHSLPQFALALNWDEVIDENWKLIHQRFPKEPQAPKRILPSVFVEFQSLLCFVAR